MNRFPHSILAIATHCALPVLRVVVRMVWAKAPLAALLEEDKR